MLMHAVNEFEKRERCCGLSIRGRGVARLWRTNPKKLYHVDDIPVLHG